MAPSSSGVVALSHFAVWGCLLFLWQISPTLAAGLTFAQEPKSEFIENGKVRFTCEPNKELKSIVEMTKCGDAHMLEMREWLRASYRCEISVNGSFPLRLVSQTAESIATTINNFSMSAEAPKDRHVEVMEGAIGVIPCSPLPPSEPPAVPLVIKDSRNSVNLTKSSRFHAMPSGNVYVRNARLEDSSMYRCLAQNPLTREVRDAPFRVFLVVQPRHMEKGAMRVNATIVHRPPDRVEAVVGSNVTLECLGDGWPQPIVKWQRVGSYLPGQIDNEGTLTLISVIAKYGGVYECSVSNFVTEAVRTTLIVHEPPVLREPDLSKSVFEVETNSSVSLDCELVKGEPRPNITWLFNGERLYTQEDRHVFVHDREVYISRVRKAWHHGHYQCFATNVLGQTYVQFLVRVISSRDPALEPPSVNPDTLEMPRRKHRVDSRTRVRLPAPPRPMVRQASESAVEVRWNDIPTNNFSIQFLKVQYIAKGVGELWKTPDDEIDPNAKSFLVDGLVPRKYRFRLLTVFENQDHKTGKSSEWITLMVNTTYTDESTASDNKAGPEASHPSEEVPRLTAAPEAENSITIQWTMTRPQHLQGFELAYRRADIGGDWHLKRLPEVLPWTFTIIDLEPSKYYELKIAAIDERGIRNFSATFVARTLDVVVIDGDQDSGKDVNHREPNDNSLEPMGHDILRFAVYKQQAVLVLILAGTLGVACLVFLACVAYYGKRLASDRIADERVRRQREAAAYVNDANSTFTPSISTVDLESTHGQPLEQTLEGLVESESDSDSLSMKSVSHEEVPRSEKEYALKILTQLYGTGSGHIVNMNGNFDLTRVQSV
ncbi:interference hedgehog-like isoform X2 [Varroa destructor]|uniref:Uncharacterized protein n=1 Tax=Varroa destructor TaxID=109461 RepID=A0A7M7KJE0_VARDE|nr:interference hedgehog-like isoform X2 [Varroa destructor]